MSKSETSKNGFPDLTKVFGDFRLPGIDVEAIAAIQRKNVEAFTQAHQVAVEGARIITQRQADLMHQAIDRASAVLRELTEPNPSEDRIAKNVEIAKEAFDNGVASARELAELANKTGTDVVSVISRRVSESFDDLRHYAKNRVV